MAGEPETILYRREPPLATLLLNRADRLNAISPQMMQEVGDAIDEASADGDVRVIVLAGTPESRAFSAGYDIAYDPPPDATPYDWRTRQDKLREWELRLWNCPKPVIASVHGYCLGGACELAMLADLVIASDDARFGEPEIRFTAGPPALIMPWIIGIKRAKQLLMTGHTIDARTAESWGMVNVVVPRSELVGETERWARRLSKIPAEAQHYTKVSINKGMEVAGLAATLQYGTELCALLESTSTALQEEFRARQRDEGLGSALKWLRDYYEDDDAQVQPSP